MKEKNFVVVLIGHKRKSGKDTFATFLEDELKNLKLVPYKTNFAKRLKELVAAAKGITVTELDALKNSDNGKTRKDIIEFSKKHTSLFGNMWVKTVKKEIETNKDNVDVFIITDFRLLEEFKELEDFEPITIKVNRREVTDSDRTETELNNYEFDIVIDNTKERTLMDLRDAAIEVSTILETVLLNKYMESNDKDWIQNREKIWKDNSAKINT